VPFPASAHPFKSMELATESAPAKKITFHVRRVRGVAEAAAPQLNLVVHGRSIGQLRTNIASALRLCFGKDRGFELLVGKAARPPEAHDPSSIRPGDQVVMIVKPPPQYAGTFGARATVVSASDHVYVQFEGGLLETYPARLFSTFFVRRPDATA
jgi:hypothetical protein